MAASSSWEDKGLFSAVTKVEEKFRSTDSELTNLERKLEVEYATMFDDQDSLTDRLRNPVQVVQRINEVKMDFAKIKQDLAEVQKQQKEALEEAKVEFDKLLSALSSLENNVIQTDQPAGSEVVEGEQKLLSLIDHMAKKTAASNTASSSSDQPLRLPSTS